MKTAAGVTYTYDGDGRRVQKSNGKLYWFGAGGEVIAESDASGNITDEFVFFGGKRIARRNVSSGNVFYYFADHLGSSRVVLQSGQSTPCYDADFDPFGGEHVVTNTCPQNYKFTGKERDAESGLDDLEARYYSSQFGRFHSADWSAIPVPVRYADLGNPQTLNLYAYVKNNPLNLTDPTGHSISTDPSPRCSCAGAHEQLPGLQVGSDVGLGGTGDSFSSVNADIAYGNLTQTQQNLSRGYADQQSPPGEGEQRSDQFYQNAWNNLSNSQRVNFAAITNALAATKLENGTSGLSQVKSISSIGEMDIGVNWRDGASKAFQDGGFSGRWGWGHPGESGMTPGGAVRGLHLLFNDKNPQIGHVHIDYRQIFKGHYQSYNSDVRAVGPETVRGRPINNYEVYRGWYGPIPGYNP